MTCDVTCDVTCDAAQHARTLAAKRGRVTRAHCISCLPSHVWSTSFIFLAWGPFLLEPVMSMGMAFCMPTSAGSRCVPPKPGSSPSITCVPCPR